MNPELVRNLWLELTPRRMATMAGVLALIFFASALSGGFLPGPGAMATLFYYGIVVIWGSRNAAAAVVGEIREHTWDIQRLSSLGPGTMMWGKLLGATSYNWFGGLICLAVMLTGEAGAQGVGHALFSLIYYLVIGVIAQSAAFLASLIAVGRDRAHSRFDVFLYQAVGLIAALAAALVWTVCDPAGSVLLHRPAVAFVGWWGRSLDARAFLLVSLAAFAGWLFVGSLRRMRIELQMRNGPFVWLGFLAFAGIYASGFDGISAFGTGVELNAPMARLMQAAGVFYGLAYLMAFLEPKNRVKYRWIGGEFAHGRIGAALSALQGWMMTWAFALIAGLWLAVWLGRSGNIHDLSWIAAWLGFLTRDMALIALAGMMSRRMSDLSGLAILFALYLLLPMILDGLGCPRALVLFRPDFWGPPWLSPLLAWSEAVLAIASAAFVTALPEKKAE
jgi:hypothetical protein